MPRQRMSTFAVSVPLALLVAIGTTFLPRVDGQTTAPKAKAGAAKGAVATPLDLNKATAEEMIEVLPGVGEATAKKIVAGRPYSSVDDLSRAGVPARTITAIRPLVVVHETAKAKAAARGETPRKKAMTRAEAPADRLDLNTATAKQMVDTLPGVGEATASRIIAGRPYASVDDLSRAGVPARTITALRDHVLVSAPPTPTPVPTAPSTATPRPRAEPKTATKPATRAASRPVPGKPVNINTASREELDTLPGIGAVKSQAIIDGRPFKTKEDVMKVKGIKQGEFSKIKDLISVD